LAGRQIWVLPWKYNRLGIINTLRAVREGGNIEDLAKVNPAYACQIKGRKTWTELTNITYTVISSAVNAGMIFVGVGPDVPEAVNQGTESYEGVCSVIP
jgi:hypothetical protein